MRLRPFEMTRRSH